jgi:hypothetical protein
MALRHFVYSFVFISMLSREGPGLMIDWNNDNIFVIAVTGDGHRSIQNLAG